MRILHAPSSWKDCWCDPVLPLPRLQVTDCWIYDSFLTWLSGLLLPEIISGRGRFKDLEP